MTFMINDRNYMCTRSNFYREAIFIWNFNISCHTYRWIVHSTTWELQNSASMNNFNSLVQQHRYEIYRYSFFFYFFNAPTFSTLSVFRDSFILVQKGKTTGISHFSSCIFPSFFFYISSKDRKYSRIARYNYTERSFLSRDRAVCYRII